MKSIVKKGRAFTIFCLLLGTTFSSFCQTDSDINFKSEILKTERQIKIHLPKSYNDSISKTYALLFVLDSETTYYLTAGNTENLYDPDPWFEVIPETIVVGIHQNYSLDGTTYNYIRGRDCGWDAKTGKFSESSKLFYQFIATELLPFLKSEYRINDFNAILGHSLTASFVSSMLLENDDLFKAYIMISPNWEAFDNTLFDNIEKAEQTKLVYVSTCSNDLSVHLESITTIQNEHFSKKEFKNVKYLYNYFEGEEHNSVVNRSIPYAIKHIFSYYNPIENIKIEDFISSKNKLEFLKNVYKVSNELYDTNRKLRDGDLEILADLAVDKKEWKILKEISDINIKLYPNLQTGYFTRAVYEEKHNKDLETALKYYKWSLERLEKGITSTFYWTDEIKRVEKLLSEKK